MEITDCRYKKACKRYTNKHCPINNTEETDCIKLYKTNQLYDLALLTEKQRNPIVMEIEEKSAVDEKAFKRLKDIELHIEDFVKCKYKPNTKDSGIQFGNLYIYSPKCGNGKTYWATKLLQAYIDTIWSKTDIKCRALFVHVPTFFLNLKDSISKEIPSINHIKENAISADLIVWDDIATKDFTTYEIENIMSIINSRINAGKANIYTSNVDGFELERSMGERLYSRVYKMSEIITFSGADKRTVYKQ